MTDRETVTEYTITLGPGRELTLGSASVAESYARRGHTVTAETRPMH